MAGSGEIPGSGVPGSPAFLDHVDAVTHAAEEARRGTDALYGFAGPEYGVDPSLGARAEEAHDATILQFPSEVPVTRADRRLALDGFAAFMKANPHAYDAVLGEAA